VTAFLRTYLVEGNLHGSFAFRRMTGGFDLLSVEMSEPRHIEFIIRARNSPLVGYGAIDVSQGDPPRVRGTLLPLGRNVTAQALRIDAPTRARVVDRLAALVDSFYVLPDVGKRMHDTLHARLRRGAYDTYAKGAGFAIRLRAELDEIAHDKHLQILYTLLPAAPESAAGEGPGREQPMMDQGNCGFRKAEQLDGNVGYLRLDGFDVPAICDSAVGAAMTLLAGSHALIIDLRENGGGGKASAVPVVASYLFDRRTHLYDLYDRRTGIGITKAIWTEDTLAGRRFGGGKPVYVLTSAYTRSAAEALAYTLQALKRATIVGETTSGEAHPTFQVRVGDHFGLLLPAGKTVNSVTGTDWEGVGVAPDVNVPASEALAAVQKLLRHKTP
jgi:hypothetical protein